VIAGSILHKLGTDASISASGILALRGSTTIDPPF
jgi:hypothetical protein